MNILVHHDNPNQYWLVDTPSRLDGAKRALFNKLDHRGCYTLLPFEFYELLKGARQGDIHHITAILRMRNGCPNHTWSLETATTVEDTSDRYKPNYLVNMIRRFLSRQP